MKITRKNLKRLNNSLTSVKHSVPVTLELEMVVVELEMVVLRNLSNPFANSAWLLKRAYALRIEDLNYEYPKTLLVAEEQITNETNKEKPKKIWHHYIS